MSETLMPFARIEMVGTNPQEGETLTIHVLLKRDGTPNRNFAYAGWRGRPKEKSWCWPVVFSKTGRVDHGGLDQEGPADRCSHMQIYDKPFEVDAIYTMTHTDGSLATEFRVSKVFVEKAAWDPTKELIGELAASKSSVFDTA
ncbi:hypothetical protein [Novosphingobium sp.]|uniref:hypothetical protein n=1 Tax=Novosphingobium sp. TaxID=1874826 RepID=UPI0038BA64E9